MEKDPEESAYHYIGLNETEKAWLAGADKSLKAEKRAERQQERRAQREEDALTRERETLSSTAERYQDYIQLRTAAKKRGKPLTEAENDVCLHFEMYKLSSFDIAKALGLSYGSVRAHKSTGERKLHPWLKKKGRNHAR
jgi:DNA-directed RNA polymerase specialized sigma24 family protein